MRKNCKDCHWKRGRHVGGMALMCAALLFLPFLGFGTTDTVLQEKYVTLSMKGATLKEVIWEIEKQTEFVFAYNVNDLSKVGRIDVEVKKKTVEETLKDCLAHTGLTYVVQNGIIVIRQQDEKPSQAIKEQTVKGRVMDKDSIPLPGVTVLLKGTSLGVSTNMDGEYTLNFPEMESPVLVFSFVGMKTQEINVKGKTTVDVVMEEEQTEMDEVVVTGIYTRKKESVSRARRKPIRGRS